ncbi:MAG: hypothetical protein IJF94_04805 [Eubacterium sp.]|nr:hypothetical protein [Eubacterium sp.]
MEGTVVNTVTIQTGIDVTAQSEMFADEQISKNYLAEAINFKSFDK